MGQDVYPRCEHCAFPYGGCVGTKGPPDSPFVIVGESPGKDELREGKPFVGQSGEVIDFALKQNVLPWEPYFINAFQCFPGRTDTKEIPTVKAATSACHNRLVELIAKHPRHVILSLGSAAAWSLLDNYEVKITNIRGRRWDTPLADHMITTYHPAYVLRGASLRQFTADVDYAQKLALEWPIRVPGKITWSVLSEYTLWSLAQRLRFDSNIQYVASDTETTGLDHVDHRIICSGFTYDGNHVYVVPEHLVHKMEPLYDNDKEFVWHNGKFDIKFIWRLLGKQSRVRVDHDTMLQSYTLDETRGVHDLETVAGDWLNSPNWKYILDEHLLRVPGYKRRSRRSFYECIPRNILHHYMALDIADTWRLNQILLPKVMKDPANTKLYTRTMIPGSKYLAHMEDHGAPVDFEEVHKNKRRLGKEMKKWRRKLRRISRKAGYNPRINPNSPIQIAELLYDYLKIPSKTRSTDKDILAHLPHPAVATLIRYRKVAKARSTYVISIDPVLDEREENKLSSDGFVHTTYKLHGTPTGRLASSEPNMQNIPRDPLIRGQYKALEGRIFAEIDLNQAELRTLACLSGDKVLCQIYTENKTSIHEVTRASIYDVPDNWTKGAVANWMEQFSLTEATRYTERGEDRILVEQKMRAKAVNFGIVYGREAPSLAEEFEIAVREAQRWVDAWPRAYPQAWEFIQVCRNAPAKNKTLITPFGRRKRCGVVSLQRLKSLQNEAANYPHQSIAADITNQGGIQTYEQLMEEFDTYIWNTVHDSNLLDLPDAPHILQPAIKLVVDRMEAIPKEWGLTRIPFVAEAKIGYRWGVMEDAHKYFKRIEDKMRVAA